MFAGRALWGLQNRKPYRVSVLREVFEAYFSHRPIALIFRMIKFDYILMTEKCLRRIFQSLKNVSNQDRLKTMIYIRVFPLFNCELIIDRNQNWSVVSNSIKKSIVSRLLIVIEFALWAETDSVQVNMTFNIEKMPWNDNLLNKNSDAYTNARDSIKVSKNCRHIILLLSKSNDCRIDPTQSTWSLVFSPDSYLYLYIILKSFAFNIIIKPKMAPRTEHVHISADKYGIYMILGYVHPTIRMLLAFCIIVTCYLLYASNASFKIDFCQYQRYLHEGTRNATGEEQDAEMSSASRNDVIRSKPSGNLSTDVTSTENRPMSFFKRKKIGTWNVQTMNEGKLDIVKLEMARTKTQLLAVSEIKWKGKGHFNSDDSKIYFSGHDILRRHSVGFICDKLTAGIVMGYNPVNDRIISIRLNSSPIKTTIIQIHAPTTAADNEAIEEFYGQLQNVVDKIPKRDMLIIMGDFNAKVGEEGMDGIAGKHGLGQWRSSVQSAKTLPGADCGSDRELLISEIRLKLKKVKRSKTVTKYDLHTIPEQYRVETRNRFAALNIEEKDPDELWQEVDNVVKEEAEKHIPKAKRVFQRQARRDDYLNDQCAAVEENNRLGKTRDLFKKIREITGTFKARLAGLKSKSGGDLCEETLVKNRWKEYAENLYKRDENITTKFVGEDHEEEPNITKNEVSRAMDELANGKSPGFDDIPIELLKNVDQSINVMTAICQQIWKTGKWPMKWKESVYTIPKSGDCRVCSNNRTIALISHASKIMLKVIQHRLEPYMEREMSIEQAGFRKGRGTRDQIANIRWIMERSIEYQQPVFTITFSATSHGKGIIDGIGGRAKYLVRHKVISKSSTPLIIQNSQDFANAANQLMEKTTVIHISQRQINEFNEKYDGFKNVEAYPGISKCHIASYIFPDKYMGLSYPGEVTYAESSQIRVNVMEKAGTHYKWPNVQDNIFYSYDDVIMKLAPPVVADYNKPRKNSPINFKRYLTVLQENIYKDQLPKEVQISIIYKFRCPQSCGSEYIVKFINTTLDAEETALNVTFRKVLKPSSSAKSLRSVAMNLLQAPPKSRWNFQRVSITPRFWSHKGTSQICHDDTWSIHGQVIFLIRKVPCKAYFLNTAIKEFRYIFLKQMYFRNLMKVFFILKAKIQINRNVAADVNFTASFHDDHHLTMENITKKINALTEIGKYNISTVKSHVKKIKTSKPTILKSETAGGRTPNFHHIRANNTPIPLTEANTPRVIYKATFVVKKE
ncbi:Craniofacial development protein 2 [Nymphon striatum]|nr:Craniofacial development protein 2 [Nymphon striatum]